MPEMNARGRTRFQASDFQKRPALELGVLFWDGFSSLVGGDHRIGTHQRPSVLTRALGTESFGGTCFCLGGFFFAVFGRRGGFEAPE